MVGFPLFMTNSYYNIQESKLYFYLYTTYIAAGLVLTLIVYGHIAGIPWDDGPKTNDKTRKPASGKNKTAGKNAAKSAESSGEKGTLWAVLKRHMLPADWFAALFLIVVLLSTACSEWKYEAFWGNMGRYQGGYLWFWYIVTYTLVSRLYRPKQWHMDLFIATGLIVCIWGVMDCFWKSPIHWQIEHENGSQTAFDFSSTFGNVNILTAAEGMYLMAASAMFIGVEKTAAEDRNLVYRGRQILYFVTACAAFMGLVCGCSDNALISAATAICFLPFFAFRSLKGIVRYAGLLAGYFGTMFLTGMIGRREGQKVVIRWKWGKLLEISIEHPGVVNKLLIAALILLAVLVILYVIKTKKRNQLETGVAVSIDTPWKGAKPLRIIWAGLGVLAACTLIWIFYDANHGGHPDLYEPYRSILIFDDAWGTHRGYNWRLAMKYFKDFPLYKKLIGSGPETYGIYTHVYDHYAMLDMFDETYDSPHNEWLQYLFTTGILGFIGYYGMVKSALWCGFGIGRKQTKVENITDGKKTAKISASTALCGVAFAYALQVYTMQSFVNISIPVILPLVILSIGVCVAVGRLAQNQNELN